MWIHVYAKCLDGEYDAIVLADAGLTRLGLQAHITEMLSTRNDAACAGTGRVGCAMPRR